jgi:hypothetical protein
MEKLTLSRCKAQALLADPSLNVNCCNCHGRGMGSGSAICPWIDLPSSKLAKKLWKGPFVDELPTINGDFP